MMKKNRSIKTFDDVYPQVFESSERKEKWYITGDTHGVFLRFEKLPKEECNVIILGDSEINYCLNEIDDCFKKTIEEYFPHITFYFVRGNCEERPENLPNIHLYYDEKVKNNVYIEEAFPHLKYFIDGNEYQIDGYSVLTIGGAYSIDKNSKISNGMKWFESEQLLKEEMAFIENSITNKKFDLVLTHTCPYEWQPLDLFALYAADKTMEEWLSKIEKRIKYKKWLFGHFHMNIKINNKAVMLFDKIVDLDYIMKEDKICHQLIALLS